MRSSDPARDHRPTTGAVPEAEARCAVSLDERRERRLAIHIISASATLVGVCLTVSGALWIVNRLQGLNTVADGMLTLDALASTTACAFAYASLRTHHAARAWWYERIADGAFLLALVLMTMVCALIAYEII